MKHHQILVDDVLLHQKSIVEFNTYRQKLAMKHFLVINRKRKVMHMKKFTEHNTLMSLTQMAIGFTKILQKEEDREHQLKPHPKNRI